MKINADFARRAAVPTDRVEWVPSPMPGVERKMLDRVGDEVARVISIVRYAPGSRFSPHTHDGGEEFLVLDGVFQDEHGDFPTGTYVRNPPGSRHRPGSKPGCTILVELRQFDLDDREHIVVDTAASLPPPLTGRPGVSGRVIHEDARECVRVEDWAPGAQVDLTPRRNRDPLPQGRSQRGRRKLRALVLAPSARWRVAVGPVRSDGVPRLAERGTSARSIGAVVTMREKPNRRGSLAGREHGVILDGEIAVQDLAGVPQRAREMAARAIRDVMPEQHQALFATLPAVFLALTDRHGRPWATFASGKPGFVRAVSPLQLHLRARPAQSETLGLVTAPGARVGLIGIDFATHTRRRNRANGRVLPSEHGLAIEVEQSFGNCPKYIVPLFLAPLRKTAEPIARRAAGTDDADVRTLLARANTFFIASRSGTSPGAAGAGLDMSHRGGSAGVLEVRGDGTLSFPDFPGNRYFNTLGNIRSDGCIGLFVPDFATSEAVFLTGPADIDWMPKRTVAGDLAERRIDVAIEEAWHVQDALLFAAHPVGP